MVGEVDATLKWINQLPDNYESILYSTLIVERYVIIYDQFDSVS